MTDFDILTAWWTAIGMVLPGKSIADASRIVTKDVPWVDMGRLASFVEWLDFATRHAVCDRLVDLGALPGIHHRHVEINAGAPWFIGPLGDGGPDHVQRCAQDAPTDDGRDWRCDELDPTAAPVARVQLLDAVTLVLVEGDGLVVVSTDKRVAPITMRPRAR